MKKITFTLAALLAALCATAQTKFWVCKNNGTYFEHLISDVDSITFTYPSTPVYITDYCGNIYNTVKIGGQEWLVENMHCNRYDTESEAYKEGRFSVLPSSGAIYEFTPYYFDATTVTKPSYMTDEQFSKLGYLYNWAAAVGVADGLQQTIPFIGMRQGICPNGWHIPTIAEWQTLQDYIEKTEGKGADTAGKHLKTTSGWKNGGGEDTYGFAALPASSTTGSRMGSVGEYAYFWTATSNEIMYDQAYSRFIDYYYDHLPEGITEKSNGQSVRCLRN